MSESLAIQDVAARFRRLEDGEDPVTVYPGRCDMSIPLLTTQDENILARAWVKEHLEDDQEIVVPEWLLTVGWGVAELSKCCCINVDDVFGGADLLWCEDGWVWLDSCSLRFEAKTRGQLRNVLKVLDSASE